MLLAGGHARRFGGLPKGLAIVKEIRIADRALIALRGASDSQIVISNDSHARLWFPSMYIVADETPGLGPLAGIATALRAADGAAILVIAWDMPFVTAPLMRGMRAVGELASAAVIPSHGAGPIHEPLCAYYPANTLGVCEQLLAAGERRALALRDALPGVMTIPERVLLEHGAPDRLFLSVDSPEQLEALGGILPNEDGAPRR